MILGGAAFAETPPPVDLSVFSISAVNGEKIRNSAAIQNFYAERNGTMMWVDTSSQPAHFTDAAQEIVASITNSWEQGLNPENYHIKTLKDWIEKGIPQGREIDGEIVMSDAAIQSHGI